MAGSVLWKLWVALLLAASMPSSRAQTTTTTTDGMQHIVCPTGKATGVLPEIRSACAALSSEIAAAPSGAITVVTEITFPPTTFYASTESNGQVTFVPHTATIRSSRVTLEMTMSSPNPKGAASTIRTSSKVAGTLSSRSHTIPLSTGSGATVTRSSSTTAATSSLAADQSKSGSGGLSGGDIAGIVLGVVLGGLFICIFILLCVAFRQRRAKLRAAENDMLFDTEAKPGPFGTQNNGAPELPPAPSETVLGGTWLSNRSSDIPDEFNDHAPLVNGTEYPAAAADTQILPQEGSRPAVPATMFGTSANPTNAVSSADPATSGMYPATGSHGMSSVPVAATAAGAAGGAALAASAYHYSHHDEQKDRTTAYSPSATLQPVGAVLSTPDDSLSSNRGSGGSPEHGIDQSLQVNDHSPAPSEVNSSNLGVGLVSTGTGVFVPSHQKTRSASGIIASGDSSPSSSATGVPTTSNSSPLGQHAELSSQHRTYGVNRDTNIGSSRAQPATTIPAPTFNQPQIEVQTPTPTVSATSMALPGAAAVVAGGAAAVATQASARDRGTGFDGQWQGATGPVEPPRIRQETATPTTTHGYGYQGYTAHDQESQGYSASETEGEFVTPMTSRLNLDGSSQYATGSSNQSHADDDADDQDPGETPRQTMIGIPVGQHGQHQFSQYATPSRAQQYASRPRSDSLGSDRTPTPPRTPRGGPLQHEDDVLDDDDESAAVKRRREAHRISADLGHMPGSWYDPDPSDLPESLDGSSTVTGPGDSKLRGFDFGFVRPDVGAEEPDGRINP